MAVTKIKPIHSTLKAAINYIVNPKKTEDFALVDSFGCSPKTAYLEFALTASSNTPYSFYDAHSDSFDAASSSLSDGMKEGKKEVKKGRKNILAFHVIQSFKPSEISKELAHEIGLTLAKNITKGSHEYIVSTHVDKNHIHNHIIFNAVDFKTKKKYDATFTAYNELRSISDNLCKEHGLSVIEKPLSKGKSYYEWMLTNEGKSYKESMRNDLNSLIKSSLSFDDLILSMTRLGYEVKFGKYLSFKAPGSEKFTRVKSLGTSFTEDAIKERILNKSGAKVIKEVNASSFKSSPSLGLISSVEGILNNSSSSFFTAKNDLKKLNATYLYIKDAGIDSLEDLSNALSENQTKISSVKATIKSLETKIIPFEEYLKYASTYLEFKDIYDSYKDSNYSKDFEAKHRREIMLFEIAASSLKASPLSFNPPVSISSIKDAHDALKAKIDLSYDTLKSLKDDEKKLLKVRKNIEGIMGDMDLNLNLNLTPNRKKEID